MRNVCLKGSGKRMAGQVLSITANKSILFINSTDDTGFPYTHKNTH